MRDSRTIAERELDAIVPPRAKTLRLSDSTASTSRKCTPRAEERSTKCDLERALHLAGLDGHRDGAKAAFVIGVAITTLHGWRNVKALDRLPTKKAVERLLHVAEMNGNPERFLRVVGAK